MKDKIPKLLLTGPGHGNNILKSLELLNKDESFEILFLTRKYSFDNERFQRIKVIEYHHPNKYIRLLKLFFKVIALPKIDLLYMQDNMGYDFFILKWFLRYNKLVFNIWSENIINNFKKKGLPGIISRIHLNNADIIICLWYGTYDKLILSDNKFAANTKVFPMGSIDSFFKDKEVKSDFMKTFLCKISLNHFVLLNLRSISDYNAIEVLLDAMVLIKEMDALVFENLLLIFWHGNNIDEVKYNYINNFIGDNQLENNVWCIKHPFLPDSDIKELIKRSNVTVNLVNHDQLSSSIYESMYLEKDLLCSDIESYRILNKKFETKLNLVKNDPKNIADEIIRLKYGNQNEELKKHRKSIVEQNFSASVNQKKKFDYINKTLF